MIITLTIILFSLIANATFAHTLNQFTDKIDISVYLKDEVTEVQRGKLVSDLKKISNVRDVSYISKDMALETYKEANKDNLSLLLAISQTDNPLPMSLRVKLRDPDTAKVQPIINFLNQPQSLQLQSDKTSYSGDRKDAINNITRSTSFMRKAGVAGAIVFTLVSVLIIFNTIRMTIFNRRDELSIMRLLGASTWFIRGPFVVETVLYGIVSGIVSVLLLNVLFEVSASAFGASSLGLLDIKYANDYFASHFWLILIVQLVLGILIGAASSIIATRRYLKFKTSK